MSEIEREIASQPSCWRQAASREPSVREALPAPGTRVAVIGCGTSLFVAQAYATLREALGKGETDAFPASEVPTGRAYDHLLAISRSGTTTEVARTLSSGRAGTRVAVVGVPDTPVARAADRVVTLEFADERSVVQTRFATTALALLRANLGQELGPPIREAEATAGSALPADPVRFSHFVFLGRGWSVGLASEAALKLREAAQVWTESYPAMEYRHGPISVAGPSTLVWALGDVGGSVLEDARATGATVVGGDLDPMVELIGIQRAAVRLAEHRGLDPDRPPHLTRSVVLS